MATPSIMRRLGDTAKKYSPFPDDNEFESLKETQKNVDQAVAPKAEEKPAEKPAVGESLNRGEKYGDRPGEKRIDTSEMTKPLGSLPVYDEGGDVDVNDGKHQVAILQNGEKVLTPEEAQQYDEQQGAPADFGGRVFGNPKGIRVHDSENDQPDTERISGGAKMSTETAPLAEPKMDISNPPANSAEALSETKAEVPRVDTVNRKPKMDPNSALGQLLQHDKEQAAASGDLVGMGKAVLNEKHLPTDVGAGHDAGDVSYKNKLQDYDQKIQAALDKAATSNDPAFQEQADRLRIAKAELEKANPWGSAENHPGVLGKIGHVAARIGNVAGDIAAPAIMQNIPGTDLNKQEQRSRLGSALTADTEARLSHEAEENKLKIAEAGKTPEQKDYNYLLTQTNPDTNKPYTPDEASQHLNANKADVKEKEGYIADRMKETNPKTGANFTKDEATENYYQMRAGTKPPNAKDAAIKDYMASHKLEDSPINRDLARQEIEKRDTDIKQKAALPYAEQKIRLQSELGEANAHLNQISANALQRGEKADEFVKKENDRHNLRVAQIDAAQNALEGSDTNMLAASIVPVLATMTETTQQGIKRLNPQELARFMPKSSGDAKQWFAANYDKLVAGQIPPQYRTDLRELLNGLAHEEQAQNDGALKSIDQTLKQGAVTPVVNEKGKASTTKKSDAASKPIPQPDTATHTGKSKADGLYYWLDAKGNKVGVAPTPKTQ